MLKFLKKSKLMQSFSLNITIHMHMFTLRYAVKIIKDVGMKIYTSDFAFASEN